MIRAIPLRERIYKGTRDVATCLTTQLLKQVFALQKANML